MHHQIELQRFVEVAASAELIYDIVTDIVRTGERSPECVAATWTEGDPGAVGSRFVGSNYELNKATGKEYRWDMTCQVIVADRPASFAWSVLTEAWDLETSVWRYDISETDDGVILTHSYRMTRPPKGWQPILDRHGWQRQEELVAVRRDRLDRGMRATLLATKALAENERSH